MAEKNYDELLEAIRTVNRHHNLGDAIYAVREREAEGWDGPKVTEYSNAVVIVNKHLKGDG